MAKAAPRAATLAAADASSPERRCGCAIGTGWCRAHGDLGGDTELSAMVRAEGNGECRRSRADCQRQADWRRCGEPHQDVTALTGPTGPAGARGRDALCMPIRGVDPRPRVSSTEIALTIGTGCSRLRDWGRQRSSGVEQGEVAAEVEPRQARAAQRRPRWHATY